MRNHFPAWLDLALLCITWVAIFWRVHASTSEGAPRRLTESLAAGAVALTLKVGPIYDIIVPITGPAVLRALIHGACLVAVAGVISLWLAAQGDVQHPRLVSLLYASSGALTALLVLTAAVAPRSGVHMESAPSAWALGYFALFCLPTLIGLVLLVRQLIGSWKLNRSRLIGTTVTLVYALLVVDNLSVFAAVIFSAISNDRSLLDGRNVPDGVTFAVLIAVGAVVSAVAAGRGAEHRLMPPMTAMWLDLRKLCPDVTLSDPWSFRGREQRLRAVVESVDALAQLAPLVSARGMEDARRLTEGSPALVLAAALQEAATEIGDRGCDQEEDGLLAADAVGQVGELSMQWQRAKELRAASDRGQQRFPRGRGRFPSQADRSGAGGDQMAEKR